MAVSVRREPAAGGRDRKVVGVSLPPELKRRLDAVAQANERTLAQEIRLAVRRHLRGAGG